MTLHPIEGHEGARAALRRSFRAERLPSTLLFHGPAGVGKQRLALWTGQLLLCERPRAEEEGPTEAPDPCGSCRGCHLALRLEHPDLHWYFPLKKPPARGSREKDREALEEARQQRLAEIRDQPLFTAHSADVLGIHLGTIQNLLHEAGRRPAMASRRLFIVADAEALAAQESSAEAANALLKALEEPPDGTWFVLTSSEPGRLLPTIRSRATSVHVPRLPNDRVARVLSEHLDATPEDLDKAVALAGGSIGRALGFLPVEGEAGPLEQVRQDAFHLLRAALAPGNEARFTQALSQRPAGARGMHELFTSLGTWLRDLAAAAQGDTPVLNPGAGDWLRKESARLRLHPLAAARAIETVERARGRAAGNANPQLLVAELLFELHDLFDRTRTSMDAEAS